MSHLMNKTILFTGIVMLMASGVNAQFNVSGEFRMRGEYRDGYMSLPDSSKTPYANILGRARLLFDYKTEKFTTRFSLFDAWVFGQNYYSSDTITKNTVNVYEAWFKYNFTKSFGVKIGRMEVAYDDERLFGISNWSMWGATHDIVMAQYESPGGSMKGDAGFAVNNTAPATNYLISYNMGRNYKYMGYLYLNKKFLKNKFSVSVLEIVDAFQTSNATANTQELINTLYARETVGAGILFTGKKWSGFLNGYYQGGHYKDGREINANFCAAWVSYQVIKPVKIMIGYDHLSGNNFSDTSTIKTQVTGFSTLYGTAHRGYGYMDMFNSLTKDNLGSGLDDLYGRITVGLNDKMSVEGTYRLFSQQYGYFYSKSTKSKPLPYIKVSKSLGYEVDLMYLYKPTANFEFNAGYCFFMPTSTMELYDNLKTGTAEFAHYAYIMVTYKPNFFSTEKH